MAGAGAGQEAEEVTAAELGGVSPRGQEPPGRTGVGAHTVSPKKVMDAAVWVAGARADRLGVTGASASGKSILPSRRETTARTPLARCQGLDGLPDSLDCFCSSELLPGLCPVLRYPAPVCLATK